MPIRELLTDLQNSAFAHSVSKADHLVGAGLQIIHVLGFVLLLASLALVSLRVLGLAFGRQSLPSVAREANRLIWLGLALAVASGILMFSASPLLYFYKPVFIAKLGLLVAAVLIQLLLLGPVSRSAQPSPARARVSIVLGLGAWFGAAMAGRIIGFV